MEAFDFPEAMRRARRGLEMQLVEYVAEHPEMGYRELRKAFNLSLGAISKIMKRHDKLRRNLARKRGSTGDRKSPEKSGAVRHLFSRAVLSPVAAPAVSVSHYLKSEDVEVALKTLDRCVVEDKTDGEDSYQNLVRWLKERKGSKSLRDRAKHLVQRYERLRENS
jgi:hypothetical protein